VNGEKKVKMGGERLKTIRNSLSNWKEDAKKRMAAMGLLDGATKKETTLFKKKGGKGNTQ